MGVRHHREDVEWAFELIRPNTVFDIPKGPFRAHLVRCSECGRKRRVDAKSVGDWAWFFGYSIECANLDCMASIDPMTGNATLTHVLDMIQRRIFESLVVPTHLLGGDLVGELREFPSRPRSDSADALLYAYEHLHGTRLR